MDWGNTEVVAEGQQHFTMSENYFRTVTENPYGNLSFSSLKTSRRAMMTHSLLRSATFVVDASLATSGLAEH